MAYDFDKIAAHYDRLNHIMTFGLDRRWRRQAAKQLHTPHSTLHTVLDVACGTGDMMEELARQGCAVTGVDLSEEMLAIAKHKLTHSSVSRSAATSSPGLGEQPDGVTASASSAPKLGEVARSAGGVCLEQADAEHLPFADATFDAVTCAFGVRNFVHLQCGLGEMLRVLKPGGRLVIMEMATPDNRIIKVFYNIYARRIIPLLGKWLAGSREAYTYLPASIERFPKGEALLGILERCGATSASQSKFTFGVCRLYTATRQ